MASPPLMIVMTLMRSSGIEPLIKIVMALPLARIVTTKILRAPYAPLIKTVTESPPLMIVMTRTHDAAPAQKTRIAMG